MSMKKQYRKPQAQTIRVEPDALLIPASDPTEPQASYAPSAKTF